MTKNRRLQVLISKLKLEGGTNDNKIPWISKTKALFYKIAKYKFSK